ncbi:FAD:protein FMN transferase [Thermohalobacter berrensis]|uniref:FAD:protein FMN transferase n=1 Tax=Thermohalobacter berrensis TaxID=99594 RepID=A0A419T743_9FIRM|nr:FAD:protein FMN transferase [Thermohalobacter berrensis]RKD33208.1 thiamine biosynthesis protein ApbE [Thermohalobacter berrensis]
MHKKKAIAIFIIIAVVINLFGCTQKSEPISKTEYMLGTIATVTLFDSDNENILDKVFQRINEIEQRMSVNIEESDISKLNQNAGKEAVEVHEDVYYVLEMAKKYAQISNGAYEPTIGPLVDLWAIGTEDEKIPEDKEIKIALERIGFNNLQLLGNNKAFLKKEGMKVDLGGIAKGYAADEVNRILTENGVKRAIIDLGGNVYVKGLKEDGSKWRVGIQNPFEVRGNHIGIITLSNKAVVTSGDYERYFEEEGIRYHHILDRNTGYPARNEVAGVSVITDNSMVADALSTALFVLGVDKGLELVESMENVDVIYITKDYKVYISSGIKDNFKLSDEQFTLVKSQEER